MLFLFAVFTFSKKPIILVPGAFRSQLVVNTHNTDRPNYCIQGDEEGWLRFRKFVPPYHKCLLQWLQVYLKPDQTLGDKENISVKAYDYGGLKGVYATGPPIFNYDFLAYFKFIIQDLKGYGYQEGQDLFGAPYDWRLGVFQPESCFTKLQALVEEAYQKNGQKRVSIIAHSLGCQVTNRFLTEKTTAEWRAKYINSTTYIAPSWSGTGTALGVIWRLKRKLNYSFAYKLIDAINSLGTMHTHFPHTLAYENQTLLTDEEGVEYTGKEIIDQLVPHGIFTQKEYEQAQLNFQFLRKYPATPDVDINILYNSGYKTALGLNAQKYFGFGQTIYGNGDGLVGSAMIEWVIKNWNTGKQLRYHDMNSTSWRFKHLRLLFTQKSRDIVMNWVVDKTDLNLTKAAAEEVGEL